MKRKDPDPDKKITNADEQDVVVNQSTADHGFDEPVSQEKEAAPEPATEKIKNEERRESIEK
jgi:hypothetical protein